MKGHIVGRYRGYVIEARLEPRTIRLVDRVALKYRVSWSLRTRASRQNVTGDLTDPVMYDSESVAISSVDRRARAFIDAMLAGGVEQTTSSLFQS